MGRNEEHRGEFGSSEEDKRTFRGNSGKLESRGKNRIMLGRNLKNWEDHRIEEPHTYFTIIPL